MNMRIRQYIRLCLSIVVFIPLSHFAGFGFGELIQAINNNQPLPLLQLWRTYTMHITQLTTATLVFPGSDTAFMTTIWQAYYRSFGLYCIAAFCATLVGMVSGRWIVARASQHVPQWFHTITSIGTALPALFIASGSIAALYYMLIYTSLDVPIPLQGTGWDTHLLLPVCALTIRAGHGIAHGTARMLQDEYTKPHIVATRARGLSEGAIMATHVWPAQQSAIALVTLAQLRIMLAELIIVEYLFHWQGIGHLLARALIAPQISNLAPSAIYANSAVIAACVVGFVCLHFFNESVRILAIPAHEHLQSQVQS